MSEQIKLIISGNSSSAVAAAQKTTGALSDFESKTGNLVGRIKKHWLGLSVAVVGAYATISKGWDLAEQSAAYDQSYQAFSTMVGKMGHDAEREFQKIREASAGLIDNKSLVESANKAMSLGIPIEKLGALMEVARAKARDMGITTTQAFSDIAIGIGRGSPLIIDNLGIVLKLGVAYDEYASTLHKTSEQLTTNEKKQALLNAVLNSGAEAVDRYDLSIKTTKERMEEITASFNNAKLIIGDLIIKITVGLAGAWNIFAATTDAATAEILRPLAFIEKGINKLGIEVTMFQYLFSNFSRAAEINAKAAKDSFASLINKGEELSEVMGRISGEKLVADYESNYKKLQSLHSTAIDKMKSKSEELLQVEKDIRNTRLEMGDMILSVQQKGMDAWELYYSKIERLDEKKDMAMKLSGDDQVNMLKEVARGWAGLTDKVIVDGNEIISSHAAQYDALKNIKNINELINDAQENKKNLIEEEVNLWQRVKSEAEDTMDSIKAKIGDLPLDQKIELDIEGALNQVDTLASKIRSLEQIKPKVVVQAKVKSSPERPFSEGIEYMIGKLNSLKTNAGFVFDFSKFSSMISEYSNLQNRTMDRIQSLAPAWGMRDYQNRVQPAIALIRSESYAAKNFMETYFNFMTDLIKSLGKKLKSEGPESILNLGIKDSFATGTPYVPETGTYMLHKGEAVIPANKNTYNNSSQVNKFYITSSDPRAAAKEVAKILKQLGRYDRI